VLAAARKDLGVAILPLYVARDALVRKQIVPITQDYALAAQEIHAVYPSPKLVSMKVTTLINYLAEKLAGSWWEQELS
jgi:DNA-binding transcriptional LysR family regulator